MIFDRKYTIIVFMNIRVRFSVQLYFGRLTILSQRNQHQIRARVSFKSGLRQGRLNDLGLHGLPTPVGQGSRRFDKDDPQLLNQISKVLRVCVCFSVLFRSTQNHQAFNILFDNYGPSSIETAWYVADKGRLPMKSKK